MTDHGRFRLNLGRMSRPIPQPTMAAILIWTMLSATMNLFAFAILAAPLIEEFGVSRTQIGLLGAANTAAAALISIGIGRVVDRLGAARAVTLTMAWSGLALIAIGLAGSFGLVIGISALAGIGQAAANPATNRLISERVDPNQRGIMTGLKQSGVQLAIFLGGFTLPVLAGYFGWRTAIVVYGVISVAFSIVTGVALGAGQPPRAPKDRPTVQPNRDPLPPAVTRIAVFGFLIGVAAGGYSRFLPLFAHERLDLSVATAGRVLAVGGLAGIVARIVLGRLTQSRWDPIKTLASLSLLSVAFLVVLSRAQSIGPWIVWPLAIGIPSSAGAWNAVGMLAIIQGVPTSQAGVAAGRVMTGFLLGLAVSGPMTGRIIDQTESYSLAFGVLSVFSLMAFGSLLGRGGLVGISRVH